MCTCTCMYVHAYSNILYMYTCICVCHTSMHVYNKLYMHKSSIYYMYACMIAVCYCSEGRGFGYLHEVTARGERSEESSSLLRWCHGVTGRHKKASS